MLDLVTKSVQVWNEVIKTALNTEIKAEKKLVQTQISMLGNMESYIIN